MSYTLRMKYDVAIIGAGPSGIMAAITAARNGKQVLLLEKNPAIGRKILATGNGRCNITNKKVTVNNFHGGTPEFTSSILNNFSNIKTIDFFENLGLVLKEEDRGRMFPRTNQAKSVVEILEHELKNSNVDVQTSTEIKSINKNIDWTLEAADGKIFNSDKLILTTGGKASHQFGSSGDGIFWAMKLGHKIVPIFAALVPVEVKEEWVKRIQGIKVEAKASFYADNNLVSERAGDLIFTHYGLSGPAIMSQSREIAPLLDQKVEVKIDFITDKTANELDELIRKIFENNGAKTTKNALTGLIPMNLIPVILDQSYVSDDLKCAGVSKNQRAEIVKNLKSLTFNVTKIRPLKEAQVTRGGVSVNEVNDNLESKIVPNLFFAGEMLDIDGDSGGFNLQWAWSSGHLAGDSATE